MLKITSAQLRAFEADFRHRRRVRFLTSLRACGWIPGDMPDSTAYRRIDAAIDDARSVEIVDDEDVVRFAALAFLPDDVRRRPSYIRRVGTVLNDVDVEPQRRLDVVLHSLGAGRYGIDPLPFPPYRR